MTSDELFITSLGGASKLSYRNVYSPATFVIASENSTYKADFYTTGVNDDLIIQKAINSCPTTGGMILIKSGTYNFYAQVTMKSNIRIVGEGKSTILNYYGSNNTYMFYLNGAHFCTFENVYMDGTNAARCRAIYLYFSTDTRILDSYIEHFTGTSDSNGGMIEINNAPRTKIFRSYIENGFVASGNLCSRGIELYQSTDCIFDSCVFRYNGFEGIYMQTTSDRAEVINCLFYDNGQSTGGDSTVNLACKLNTGCRFIGNRFLGYSTTTRGQHNLEIFESTDCEAIGNYSTGATWNGIYIQDGNRNIVMGNHIISNNWSGINMQSDTSGVSDHFIANNIVVNNIQHGIVVTDNGSGTGMTNTLIKSNLIKGNTQWGINISANHTNTLLDSNILISNGSGSVKDLSNSVTTIAIDNTIGAIGIGTFTPKATLHSIGSTIIGAGTSANAASDLGNNQVNVWVNESQNALTFQVKLSTGTIKNGTISLG